MEKDIARLNGHATVEPASSNEGHQPEPEKGDVSACEVFRETSEGVNFRSVSWQRATVLFLKIQFAMSILAVPSSLGTLGAVGGALSIVGWQSLNTCMILVFVYFYIITPVVLSQHEQVKLTTGHGIQTRQLYSEIFAIDIRNAIVSILFRIDSII